MTSVDLKVREGVKLRDTVAVVTVVMVKVFGLGACAMQAV